MKNMVIQISQKQRINYKNHKLSEERFEALNAIGMIWATAENQIAVETLCEENGIPSEQLWRELLSREINDKLEIEKKMKGNNTIPISILELQAKIAYMKDKDISYHPDLHLRITSKDCIYER